MAGRIGDDKLAPVGGEEAISDVDGDALLALGSQTVDQKGEVDLLPLRASTRMTARSAVDAPVTMLRVYCSWPGVSATMNERRGVVKKR